MVGVQLLLLLLFFGSSRWCEPHKWFVELVGSWNQYFSMKKKDNHSAKWGTVFKILYVNMRTYWMLCPWSLMLINIKVAFNFEWEQLMSSASEHWTYCDADMCPRLDTCPYPNGSNDHWSLDRSPIHFE